MPWLLILILTFTGCATTQYKKVVSPSQDLYFDANDVFENEDYVLAIELYEEFLEKAPTSSLAVPAKINLGLAYYNENDCEGTMNTLKGTKIQDTNIKAIIDNILNECNGVIAKTEPSEAKGEGEEIAIVVEDAYIDDYGSIVLYGHVDKPATLYIEGAKIPVNEHNIFTATVPWRKGRDLEIIAKDELGNEGAIDFYADSEEPEEPENLRIIRATADSIEFEWDANEEPDLKGYLLFFRRKGGSLQEIQEIITDLRYEIVGLQRFISGSNKTFELYLRAVDKMNNYSEDSDILEITLP